MGEYADMAISDGTSSWSGRTDVGYGLSPIALREPKECRQCGKGHLFWAKSEGRWRLHHWSMLATDKRPRFILHRCGFTSEGQPTTAAESPSVGTDERSEGVKQNPLQEGVKP